MLFMQDGAPAHFSRLVRQYLNTTIPDRWIGRGSQMPWLAQSPDFNPLDFCTVVNKRVHKCIEVNGHHFEHLLPKVDLFVY
ncbi:hypothetical protein NQ318_010331 [Aromia moschata]|uniref:Transposase n=1 Tax=Aromia moschata TaxID=1265417 RepID=A0AAV8YHZ5_9CUCU|nr:hypothetical protein NQ318_010331 [Aromia moschata]